jgi:hypothetical protein
MSLTTQLEFETHATLGGKSQGRCTAIAFDPQYSFLASTVTRLEKLSRDFGEFKEQLRWHHTKFVTCCLVLKAWQRLWCGGARTYSDAEYEYF